MTVDPLVRLSTNVPKGLLSRRRAAERRAHLLIGLGVICVVFLALLILANAGSQEPTPQVAATKQAASVEPTDAAGSAVPCPAVDLGDDYMRKRVPGYLSPREACLLQRQAHEIIDRDAKEPGLDMTGKVVRGR